jgi:hypothetical protein
VTTAPRLARVVGGLAVALLCCGVDVAAAATDAIQLRGQGRRIDGSPTLRGLGSQVVVVGDVNGDGVADLAASTGNPLMDPCRCPRTVVVVAGPVDQPATDLADSPPLLTVSVTMPPQMQGDPGGLAPAGDVNGDGRADLLIGWRRDDERADAVTVVFGSATPRTLRADAPGTSGFVIWLPERPKQLLARPAIASAGDQNGDGLSDIVIAEPSTNPASSPTNPALHVVFGTPKTDTIAVASLADHGWTWRPPFTPPDSELWGGFGTAVTSISDRTADGIPEIAVGAAIGGPQRQGRVAIVAGSAASGERTAGGAPPVGLVEGEAFAEASASFGASLAVVGDLDGDGQSELAVGAPTAAPRGRSCAGAVYLVFSRAGANVDLGTRQDARRRLDGDWVCRDDQERGDRLGTAVAAVGDVTGDGRPDVVGGVGGVWLPDPDDPRAVAYVLAGSGTAGDVDSRRMDADGFAIRPDPLVAYGQLPTTTVAGGADVTGDRRPDLLFGSPLASHRNRAQSGSLHVVTGRADPAVLYPVASKARDIYWDWRFFATAQVLSGTVGEPVPPFAPTSAIALGTTFSVAPPLPDGLTMDRTTGRITGAAKATVTTDAHTVTARGPAGMAATTIYVHILPRPPAFPEPPVPPVRPTPGDRPIAQRRAACPAGSRPLGRAMRVVGGPLADILRGSLSADLLRGGGNGDCLIGFAGADRLFGQTGADQLLGGPGGDQLSGGGGEDRLAGESGNDRLDAGDGADRLDGGPGRDLIVGGFGADRVRALDGERDVVRCGVGVDQVLADRRDRLIGCERISRRPFRPTTG